MKVLLDTSVLIAAMIQSHPDHTKAFPWLKRTASGGREEFIIASHTLAELYAVLTTLPLQPKISPETAWRLIHENVETNATIVSLSASDYQATIKHLAELGLSGAVVYDALIVAVARKSHVQRIVTLNLSDFQRVWPDSGQQLITP